MRVRKVLGVVQQAELGVDAPTTRHNPSDALGRQRHVPQEHAGVDREVVHALLGLLDERLAEELPGDVLDDAVCFLEGLVDRDGPDGDGGVPSFFLFFWKGIFVVGFLFCCVCEVSQMREEEEDEKAKNRKSEK